MLRESTTNRPAERVCFWIVFGEYLSRTHVDFMNKVHATLALACGYGAIGVHLASRRSAPLAYLPSKNDWLRDLVILSSLSKIFSHSRTQQQ